MKAAADTNDKDSGDVAEEATKEAENASAIDTSRKVDVTTSPITVLLMK